MRCSKVVKQRHYPSSATTGASIDGKEIILADYSLSSAVLTPGAQARCPSPMPKPEEKRGKYGSEMPKYGSLAQLCSMDRM